MTNSINPVAGANSNRVTSCVRRPAEHFAHVDTEHHATRDLQVFLLAREYVVTSVSGVSKCSTQSKEDTSTRHDHDEPGSSPWGAVVPPCRGCG